MKRSILSGLVTLFFITNSSLCMELPTTQEQQPKADRVILACRGTASAFDEKQFHAKLLTLYNLSPEAIELKGRSLSAEEKAQVKASFLSYVSVILNAPIAEDKFCVDPAWITPLSTPPFATQPTLWQKIANPVTLTFGAGCALATWFALKNLNHTTE